MNQPKSADVVLERWLASAEGYSYLLAYVKAKLVSGRAIRDFGASSLASSGKHADYETEEVQRSHAHDFIEYLLADGMRHFAENPVLMANLLDNRIRFCLDRLWNRYEWKLREERRNRQKNPLGYLYRRFREVLKDDPSFLTQQNTAGFLFYSCHPKASLHPPSTAELENETFSDWPSPSRPPTGSAEQGISAPGSWLKETARFFWEQARQRRGPELLSVRDLVRYLGMAFPWLRNPQPTPMPTKSGEDSFVDSLADDRDTPAEKIERYDDLASIAALAAQLVATWSEKTCCTVLWRLLSPPATYKIIAQRLLLKSHNEAFALYKDAEKKMRLFCRSWPGPPIDELSEEVAIRFVEEIKTEVKKCCRRP